jgi:hypothetical protein
MSMRTAALPAMMIVALTACASGKSSSAGSPQPSATSAAATSLDCGREAPVWVLQGPKVYLVLGDRLYGKTKHGEYLCRSQAHALGFRPARRPFKQKR